MSYTPTIWKDAESGKTPISASSLNNIEQGISDAHTLIESTAETAKEAAKAASEVSNIAATAQATAETAAENASTALASAGGCNHYLCGKNLEEAFESEIAECASVYAWLHKRISAGNYTGINIGDYIDITTLEPSSTAPLRILSKQTMRLYVGGIDVYCARPLILHSIILVPNNPWAFDDAVLTEHEIAISWSTSDTLIQSSPTEFCSAYTESNLSGLEYRMRNSLPQGLQDIIAENVPIGACLKSASDGSNYFYCDPHIGIFSPSEVEVFGHPIFSDVSCSAMDKPIPFLVQRGPADSSVENNTCALLRSIDASSTDKVCTVDLSGVHTATLAPCQAEKSSRGVSVISCLCVV